MVSLIHYHTNHQLKKVTINKNKKKNQSASIKLRHASHNKINKTTIFPKQFQAQLKENKMIRRIKKQT